MNNNEFKITSSGNCIKFLAHVLPRAKKDEISGIHGNALKIRTTAPPVEGKANKSVINILAKRLKIAKSRIKIISGETSRNKEILVSMDRTINNSLLKEFEQKLLHNDR